MRLIRFRSAGQSVPQVGILDEGPATPPDRAGTVDGRDGEASAPPAGAGSAGSAGSDAEDHGWLSATEDAARRQGASPATDGTAGAPSTDGAAGTAGREGTAGAPGGAGAAGARGAANGHGALLATVTTFAGSPALADLLALPLSQIRDVFGDPGGDWVQLDGTELLAPVDGRTEVWAAGVTYERSRAARVVESEESADVYDQVYAAERPELFFKSAAWRVRGPGRAVSVRADSRIDVPEPELAAVLNYAGEVVGYTICNDMSSRSIEGQNPLYLPQAKIYLGGCALGPWIRPAWEVPDPYALTIELTISRAGAVVWEGQSSTSGLRRRIDELAEYLFREDEFPAGAVLSTGTSLVPDLPFTLQSGDEIRIRIEHIGELVNPVVRGKAALASAPPGQGVTA